MLQDAGMLSRQVVSCNEAQGYLEASLQACAIEVELVQAAWVRLNFSGNLKALNLMLAVDPEGVSILRDLGASSARTETDALVA